MRIGIGVGIGLAAKRSSAPAPSNTLFYDNFNRPDAPALGNPWQVFSGNWGISLNAALIVTAPDYDQIAYVRQPHAGPITVKSRVWRNNADASIVAKYNPDSRDNFYQWGVSGHLYRNVAGAWTSLGSYPPTPGKEWAELALVIDGDKIDAYYDGAKAISVVDGSLAGYDCYGMRNGSPGTSGVWDSFELKKGGTP